VASIHKIYGEKLSHFPHLESEEITPYFSLPPLPPYDTILYYIRQGEKTSQKVKNDFAIIMHLKAFLFIKIF